MKTLPMTCASLLLAALIGPAAVHGDVVTDWNDIAIPLLRQVASPHALRQFTMMHLAQFESVNAIVGKYTPYIVNLTAPGASPEAAAAQAAHDILLRLYPTNQPALDTALSNSLAAVPDGPEKTDGVTLGAAVATQIFDLRASDGSALTVLNPFPALTSTTNYPVGQGLWAPTPGGTPTPAVAQFPYVTPWAIPSSSAFRPGPPPALTNVVWTADFNEIKSLGATNSTTRTPEQTDIGLFIIEFPQFILNSAAKQALAAHPTSLVESARVFTLMHMAGADAIIATWEAKYYYDFWRPVTAIRTADTNINPATVPDPNWLPLRTTPSHPEYPAAHGTVSTAMTTALALIFGDNVTFTLEAPTLPGKPRTFNKFSDYAALTLEGRLYAGFHYRNSSMVGMDLGRHVAEYVVKNFLTPGPTLAGTLQSGQFRLSTKNVGSMQQQIETSADLKTWVLLTNYVSPDSTLQIVDPAPSSAKHKFYRAVAP